MNLSKEEAKAAFKEAIREEFRDIKAAAGGYLIGSVAAAILMGFVYLALSMGGWRKVENVGKPETHSSESSGLSSQR